MNQFGCHLFITHFSPSPRTLSLSACLFWSIFKPCLTQLIQLTTIIPSALIYNGFLPLWWMWLLCFYFYKGERKNSTMRRRQFKATDSFHDAMCHSVKRSTLLAMLLIEPTFVSFVDVFVVYYAWRMKDNGFIVKWDQRRWTRNFLRRPTYSI